MQKSVNQKEVDFVICRFSSDIEFQRKGVLKNEYQYTHEDGMASDK